MTQQSWGRESAWRGYQARRTYGSPPEPEVPRRAPKPRKGGEKDSGASMVLSLLLSPVVGLYGAFVFSRLWAWFVVGPFGAPRLSLAYAFGLLLVVGLALMPVNSSLGILEARTKSMDDNRYRAVARSLAYLISYSGVWGMAAIVALFK